MSKLLKNVIIGVASGAAAAYFLSTEKVRNSKRKLLKLMRPIKKILLSIIKKQKIKQQNIQI